MHIDTMQQQHRVSWQRTPRLLGKAQGGTPSGCAVASLTPEVCTTRRRKSWLGLLMKGRSLVAATASSICACVLISLRAPRPPPSATRGFVVLSPCPDRHRLLHLRMRPDQPARAAPARVSHPQFRVA